MEILWGWVIANEYGGWCLFSQGDKSSLQLTVVTTTQVSEYMKNAELYPLFKWTNCIHDIQIIVQ